MYTYFITPNDVKELTNISDNLSEKYILTAIREAQQTELTTVLGIHFITKLEEAVNKGELPERYTELLDNYILYFLCYNVISKLIPIASVKLDNAGAVTTGDEKVENLSLDEVFRLQDYYTQKSDYYKMRLQRYLRANKAKYPELDCTSEIHSAYSSPIFLGGKRGKHIIRPCHGCAGHISPEKPDTPDTPEKPYYQVIYTVDGNVYDYESYQEGERIIPAIAPEKDGYTFQYWEGLPEYMPANDFEVHASYSVNTYKLTYKVDGEVVSETDVEYGTGIIAMEEPVKEGYTFSGWSEIPATMPANDVEINGSFTLNSYKLIYILDGETIAEFVYEFGAIVPDYKAPEKEGFAFNGWDNEPDTMPAMDVTVTGSYVVVEPNEYTITYMIDGKVAHADVYKVGDSIIPFEAPAKEGYSFSGWDAEIPSVMPERDIVINGSYTVNSYKLVYKVDGEVVSETDVEFGTEIVAIEEPVKEGYTFSGWSEIPATMPAKDVEINGSFTINSYNVYYTLYDENGDVYLEDYVTYRYTDTINPYHPDIPDGYTFSWDNEPTVMPASDVHVTGSLTKVEPSEPEDTTDYSTMYMTLEAIEDSEFTFSGTSYSTSVNYSIDDGVTWNKTTGKDGKTSLIPSGGKVLIKATTDEAAKRVYVLSSGKFKTYGNILSTQHGDDFIGKEAIGSFSVNFYNSTNLVDASNLIFPSTDLTALSASDIYSTYFGGCTSLVTAPKILPSTSISSFSYKNMFKGCTSLTTPPVIMATSMKNSSLYSMFEGCTSLTTAPVINVEHIANYGCYRMFRGCSNLTNVTMLFTSYDTGSSNALYELLDGVAETGTFYKSPNMPLETIQQHVPSGWTILDYAG